MDIISLIGGIGIIIDKIFPNQTEVQKATIALEMAKLQGSLELAKAQAEVNAVDASSADKFQSRWRPAAAWMCVGTLALGVITKVLLPTLLIILPAFGYPDVALIKDITWQLAGIDIEMFQTMLWGLLGLGAYRSYEKGKGR